MLVLFRDCRLARSGKWVPMKISLNAIEILSHSSCSSCSVSSLSIYIINTDSDRTASRHHGLFWSSGVDAQEIAALGRKAHSGYSLPNSGRPEPSNSRTRKVACCISELSCQFLGS